MRCAAALPLFAASLIGSSSFPECANAQSNPYALDRLFLEEPNTTPLYGVLSFNSYAAVANYYGDTSSEATLASEFFAGYNGSSANMLFTRLPYLPARAHLLGSHLVDPTLAEFRSGTLSIISEDYKYSGSVNFSGLKNLTGAAGASSSARSTRNCRLPPLQQVVRLRPYLCLSLGLLTTMF